MHLAREPGPFLGPGLLGEQVALLLGPFGPVAQALQDLVPCDEVEPKHRPGRGPQHAGRDDGCGRLPDPGHDERQRADGREGHAPVPAVIDQPVRSENGSVGCPHVPGILRRDQASRPDEQGDDQGKSAEDRDDEHGRPAAEKERGVGQPLDGQHGPGQRVGVGWPPGRTGQRDGGVEQDEEGGEEHVERGPVRSCALSEPHSFRLCHRTPATPAGTTIGPARPYESCRLPTEAIPS